MTSAYIHIPFCSHICYYCDFNKVFIEGQPVDEYVDLLIREMEWTSQELKCSMDTLYIGGGTPSTLTPKQLATLLEGMHRHLTFEHQAEFTMEMNPDDVTEEKLRILKEYGVNRISMGVQSFNDSLLKAIGRKHQRKTVYEAIRLMRKTGFENISIDLIFRLPHQTIEDFKDSLEIALSLDLPHYSIYSLILEQKTIFYNLMRSGKLPLPTQDEEADMFALAMDTMAQFGREHYEISNYALPGYESQHNLHYWNADEYVGFGAGAHGYINGQRYQNCGPIQHYLDPLRHHQLPVYQRQKLTTKACMEEFMFLGLRKMKGVTYDEFERRFSCSMQSVYGEVLQQLAEQDLIVQDSKGVRLSHTGKFLGNEVFQSFLFDEE